MTQSDARGLGTSGPSSSPSWYPAGKTVSQRDPEGSLDHHDHQLSKKNTITVRNFKMKSLLLTTTVAT